MRDIFPSQYQSWEAYEAARLEPDIIVTGNYKRFKPITPTWAEAAKSADYLRDNCPPDELKYLNMTPEEKDAYNNLWNLKNETKHNL